jgi:hypothetical protein
LAETAELFGLLGRCAGVEDLGRGLYQVILHMTPPLAPLTGWGGLGPPGRFHHGTHNVAKTIAMVFLFETLFKLGGWT